MARDRLTHLEMNGSKYRYVRYVGGRSVRIPLRTANLHEALARRDALDREYDQKAPSQDWARQIAALAEKPTREEIFELIGGGATERAIAVERHTPLVGIDPDIWTAGLSGSYAGRCKRAYGLLQTFLKDRGLAETFEGVDAQTALDFAAWRRDGGDGPTVLHGLIAGLRNLWGYAGKDRADWVNPWDTVKVGQDKNKVEERPFTTEEARAMLQAFPEGTPVGDACRISGYTGMRLSEVLRLTPAAISQGVITVGKSKTRAGVRKVPVAKRLTPIISRLCKGRAPNATLFPDDANISDKFGRKLRALGLEELHGSNKRSKINFHSWRRGVAQQLEHAGVLEIVAARLLGHKIKSMTYGTYNASGASPAQLRKAVEVLRLPT